MLTIAVIEKSPTIGETKTISSQTCLGIIRNKINDEEGMKQLLEESPAIENSYIQKPGDCKKYAAVR